MAINMKNNLGKIPPQDLDIEAAVLGSLMLAGDAIHKVSGIIKAGSFYLQSHQQVFDAIKGLSDMNKPIDLLTVTKALKDRDQLDEAGGPIFITQLCSRVASAGHIVYHAGIIQQLYLQRELIKIGTETVTEAFEEGVEIDDLFASLNQKISSLENNSMDTNSIQSHGDVFQNMILEMEQDCINHANGIQPGIDTGLKGLNLATGGWRNTNLIILASRPGVGKTSLALHFAKMAARSGKWINFYSLEMKAPDLHRIMVSGESGVSRTAIRDGQLTDQDWNTINRISAQFEKLPILWYDTAGLTSSRIRYNTIRNRKAGRCDLVIIDYLQLVKPIDPKANREQQISEITRTLKGIALAEDIPIICLSQLNRAAADEKPQLHHLRESGAIEQDADIVVFPFRSDCKYFLSIAKNRRGEVGDFEIRANQEMTVFGNLNNLDSTIPVSPRINDPPF